MFKIIPLSLPKDSAVYSLPRPILFLSFVEIYSLFFVQSCRQTNKQTDMGENITSLGKIEI